MNITSIIGQFDTQATGIMFLCLIPTFLEYLIIQLGRKIIIFKIIFHLIIIISSIIYFNPISLLKLLLIILSSLSIGSILPVTKSRLINTLIGFFITLEFYTLVSLFINPKISLISIFIITLILLFITKNNFLKYVHSFLKQSDKFINQLTLIDLFLINFCFLLGSQPQLTWDASQANLYNAKWYVIRNSFKPLEESVSSLMPQNAIAYYSLFFQIGKYQALQVAYLLPLIISLIITKFWFIKFKFSFQIKNFFTLLFFSPMVIFQSTSGYYDFFLFSVMYLAITVLATTSKPNLIHIYTCLFLISYAAAIKIFPVILFLILIYFFNRYLFNLLNLKRILILFIIATLPLGVWLIRDYLFTGNPFYPFAQKIFSTPNITSSTSDEILEDHYIIQTTMSKNEWLLGGFMKYPVLSYFSTGDFLEGTKGYPTLIYIPLIFIELIILILIISKLFRHLPPSNVDFVFISILFTFLFVGLYSRYYRYLWPYQLLLGCTSFIYLNKLLSNSTYKKSVTICLVPIFFFFLFSNFQNIKESFRYQIIRTNQMFSPDYTLKNPGILPFQIIQADPKFTPNSSILDLSRYLQPRFNAPSPVYQCNWYWTSISNRLSSGNISQSVFETTISKFKYIISSDNDNDNTTYCQKYFENVKPNFTLISNFVGYKIYSNNN